MDTSSRQSAAMSIRSDSSSLYSEDGCTASSILTGTQTHNLSPLEFGIGGSHHEGAQNFEGTLAAFNRKGLKTLDSDDDRIFDRDTSSNYTAAYRVDSQQEIQEIGRRNGLEARPVQHNIRRDTALDESRTYMQRVLAEHNTASAELNSDEYQRKDEDNEEPSARLMAPAGRRPCVSNVTAVPLRHMRGTLLSTTSLASTDSGELTEEDAYQNDRYCYRLQDGTRCSETAEDSFQLVAPRPRALTLSDMPSDLWLDRSTQPASNQLAQQSATLLALAGASEESDEILPRDLSNQGFGGPTRRSSLDVRRQGRADWQNRALFSSTGRQYGLGNHEEGYVAGRYVTVIKDGAQPEKEKRRRDAWKRASCF